MEQPELDLVSLWDAWTASEDLVYYATISLKSCFKNKKKRKGKDAGMNLSDFVLGSR